MDEGRGKRGQTERAEEGGVFTLVERIGEVLETRDGRDERDYFGGVDDLAKGSSVRNVARETEAGAKLTFFFTSRRSKVKTPARTQRVTKSS